MAKTPEVVSEETQAIIEEEAFLILHSGETPEIAYHSSLYYLFEDVDGPGIEPGSIDLKPLKKAVFERYRKILLRDMNPAYRDKSIYRGLARSIANWERLKTFCTREGFGIEDARSEAGEHLLKFLENEKDEVSSGIRKDSSINCSWPELVKFARELGINQEDLPEGLEDLCIRN